MNIGEARAIVGTLSFPSKMPGSAFGLPARACIAGKRLAQVEGSICSTCYALKGDYRRGNCAKGQERRLVGITHPRWVEAITTLLLRTHAKDRIRVDLGFEGVRRQRAGGSRFDWSPTGYHRWHDSGDLQSVEHLSRIAEVCRRTPRIKHWLPTREFHFVREFLKTNALPPNLVVRMSAAMVDGPHPNFPTTSGVHTKDPWPGAHRCPAPQQDHKCGSCRACWDPSVKAVSYEVH